MNLSVGQKLFLTLLLATGLVVAGTLGFAAWSFERGFVRFVEARQQERVDALVARLQAIYVNDGGWEALAADKGRWVGILLEARGLQARHRLPSWVHPALEERSRRWPPAFTDEEEPRRYTPIELRVMLLDAQRRVIYGRDDRVRALKNHPIKDNGATVGYLGLLPGPSLDQLGEVRFLEQQFQIFAIIALAMVLLSAALSVPLARRLVRPLRDFNRASRALAEGRYDTRIPVLSGDELGRLARDFNDLAHALERNEHLRRQWVADVSHELRTPLTVLRGELEALQEGIRPLDREAVDSLHADVLRLARLVEDLYELSMSDLGALDYRKSAADPVALLEADLEALAPEFENRGIEVAWDNRLPEPVSIHADPDRLAQLFRNLLNNTLRYTDPGGRLAVTVQRRNRHLLVDFQDTAPGVPEEAAAHLFERFYRVEASRSRAHGGAGLGLAICRNIVEAHNGRISARPSPLGGLWVQVELPL